MAGLYEYYTGSNARYSVQSTSVYLAQTFTPTITHKISSVILTLGRIGTPGTVTVSIHGVVAGEPAGGAMCTGTTTGDDLPIDPLNEERTITFASPATLVSGTMYAILITCAEAGANYLKVLYHDGAGTYVRGTRFLGTFGGWAEDTADDLWFKEYGDAADIPPAADTYITKKWVAVGSNELWYQSAAATMSQLAASVGELDTSKAISIFELYGKVFICNGENKKVYDPTNTKIVTDNSGVGAHPPDFHTILTGADSGAKMVVDYVTSLADDAACTIYGKRITAATFTSGEHIDGVDDDSNDIDFDLAAADEVAPPHWYDWTVFGNSATFGAMPNQVILGCGWRGRPVISGDEDYFGQWYMGRQGNPWDWNYLANDAQSPVAGGNADAGECGDAVIALIPYNRDYLIFGCANSLWVMAGDPAENGSLYEFYSTGGILSATAWCWDKEGNLYILSSAGILKIAPGFQAVQNVTEESYPDFVADLAYNKATHKLLMGYDRNKHGIQIARTTLTTGANTCYWYDLRTGGLFPDSYPTVCGPFSMAYYEAANPAYQQLLFGCNDGYIRFADDDAKNDAATADVLGAPSTLIDSYVTFGPLEIAGENREGKIISIVGVTTGGGLVGSVTDSSDLTYKAWTGLSADEIVEKLAANTTPNIAGTISAPGRNRGAKKRKPIRGAYAGIRVGNDTVSQIWGLEKLIVEAKEGGRIK